MAHIRLLGQEKARRFLWKRRAFSLFSTVHRHSLPWYSPPKSGLGSMQFIPYTNLIDEHLMRVVEDVARKLVVHTDAVLQIF